ncbi:MAG: TolC family outer membrane protein [Gammaproteobacteria bacterium]
MKKRIVSLLTASLLTLGSQTSWGDDLQDVFQLALESDPQLQAAAAARQAVEQSEPQARALLLPNLNFTADLSRDRVDVDGRPTRTANSEAYFVSLVQPVYRRDRWVQLRQASARIAQAQAQYEATAQNLVVRTADSYFNVLAARDNLEFTQALKEAFARQLEQAKQRFEVGLVAITDVHEAQASYDSAVAQEIAAENQLSSAREALRQLTGRVHEHLAGLIEDVPLQAPDPQDPEAWAQTALDENLQLIAARYATEVAQQEIERRRSGHYPTVDLVGRHGWNEGGISGAGDGTAPDQESSSISLQLSVPLYTGGLVTAQTREARHLFEQAVAQQEDQRRATLRQAQDAYRGVITSISQVKALRQAVISSESALEATQAGYEVGTRTIVDVLDATQRLYAARRDYARSRYDYVLNVLRLKEAAGSLSEEDVRLVNAWLK